MQKSRTGYQIRWAYEDLYAIREAFMNGTTQIELAEKYNTTQKTISKIVTLKAYKDVAIPPNYARNLKKKGIFLKKDI